MWLDRISIPRKLTIAFAVTLASFAVSGAVIYNAVRDRDNNSDRASSIHATQLVTMTAASAHLDMAQTVRGFLLTNVERHKKLFEAASVQFNEQMTKAIALSEKTDMGRDVGSALRSMQTASRQWKS